MKTRNIYSILLGMTLVACLTGCNSDETTEAKPALELVMVGGKEIAVDGAALVITTNAEGMSLGDNRCG